jgi:hypothetical protein
MVINRRTFGAWLASASMAVLAAGWGRLRRLSRIGFGRYGHAGPFPGRVKHLDESAVRNRGPWAG